MSLGAGKTVIFRALVRATIVGTTNVLMIQFDETEHNKRLEALYRKEESELIRALASRYGHKYIDLNGVSINTDGLKLVGEEEARAAEIAVFEKNQKKISVAIKNPNNKKTQEVLNYLTETCGFTISIFMTSTQSLERAWKRYDDIRKAEAEQRGVLDIRNEEVLRLASIITKPEDVTVELAKIVKESGAHRVTQTLELFIGAALSLGASDIHIEPEEARVDLRFRLDGVLHDITTIDTETYEFLRSRLKLLSGLKLNIHDEAQDGRFTIDLEEKELEIRTSVIPGAYGESLVMRILDPTSIRLELESLGINEVLMKVIKEEISRPQGMIVTTGPTGSGKTTTLYAFLQTIHRPEIKIITLEDPIEYHLEGIVQTQVSNEYTFATGLRSILRQDPDVILVGEIRDREVADTAITAAETGHLVFSTLHTNSAAESFMRLLGLGVDARLIGSSVNLVMAQRLVRRLCDECKKERRLSENELAALSQHSKNPLTTEIVVYEPGECEACGGVGYKGRIGLHEAIRVDHAVEEAIIRDPRESTILEAARSQGIPSIQEDGVAKLLAGITSFEELSRVIDLYDTRRKKSEGGENEAGSP